VTHRQLVWRSASAPCSQHASPFCATMTPAMAFAAPFTTVTAITHLLGAGSGGWVASPPTSLHTSRSLQRAGGPALTLRRCTPSATAATPPPAVFDKALVTMPSADGMRARPLSTVAVWSLATGLLWYGFYKFLTEEELVTTTGEGPGAFLSLAPFVVGITGPGWLPLVGLGNGIEGVVGGEALAAGAALLGLAWIVGAQLRLYTAVNGVLRSADAPASMTWWWALVPGFNIVGGIRLIHFTAVAAVLVAAAAEGGGGEAAAAAGVATLEDDVLVRRFPWIGVPKVGALELLTTPSLWVKF